MTSLRRLTPLFGILVLLITQRPVQAQTSFYFAPALTAYGYASSNGTNFKSDSGGFIAGMFYNFPIDSRLTAGIDARVSDSFGPRGGNFETAALRIAFVPEKIRLRPFFEIGGGVVSSSPDPASFADTARPTRRTNGAAELSFGLDIRLTDSFDLRAIELGAVAGPSSNATPDAVVSFADIGVVYHLHGRVKKP
jgi:hypothetical protein